VKAKGLPRRLLDEMNPIVTWETLLACIGSLSRKNTMAAATADQADRARRKSSKHWSCAWPKKTEIGAIGVSREHLSNLGHKMARSTIADILKRHGAEPAAERKKKTTWKEFLAQHWELLVAADFFTVKVWTRKGLQRFTVLFVYRAVDPRGGNRRHRVCGRLPGM
jgi:hypothetical protein